MLGAKLNDETDMAIALDEICDNKILPDLDWWWITKLYERDGTASKYATTSELNEGYHIVAHTGHATKNILSLVYVDYVENYEKADALALTNSSRYFLLYSLGCYSMVPDSPDGTSVGEAFMDSAEGRAVAYIGNSRYGVSWREQPRRGPSDLYQAEFFDALFTEDLYRVGIAFQDSKEDLVSEIIYDGMRWCYYTLNLLGDPALRLKEPPRPEHDIVVKELHAPNYVNLGSTVYVNATIKNVGRNDETNIPVNFTLNGTIIDSITLSYLSRNDTSTNVSFQWTPTTTGWYIVGIEAGPILNENYTWQDEFSKTNVRVLVIAGEINVTIVRSLGTYYPEEVFLE